MTEHYIQYLGFNTPLAKTLILAHLQYNFAKQIVHFSPTSDGSAAAVLASEEFVKKHGLESKAVEIVGMEMATDFKSTFNDNSAIKVVSDCQVLQIRGVT